MARRPVLVRRRPLLVRRPVLTRRDHPTAGTVLVGVAAVGAAAVFLAPEPVALVGALLLTLVLPGAALTRAVFPGRALSTAEWLMLVPGLSLAALALGGLAMSAAGVGLTRWSWTLLVAAVTVVAAVVGQVRAWSAERRRARAGNPAHDPAAGTTPDRDAEQVVSQPEVDTGPVVDRRERITFRRAVLRLLPLVVAAGLLAGAGWYSLRTAAERESEPFTALVMVPAFATEAPGPTRTVAIGVQCRERADTDYLVRIRGTGFEESLTARLRPDEDWARRVAVPSTGRVTVDLYRDGGSTPYRTVFLDNPQ